MLQQAITPIEYVRSHYYLAHTPREDWRRHTARQHYEQAARAGMMPPMSADLVCFSHLRWDFVYQRPQHLMSRFARRHRVFYFEEPIVRPVLRNHITSRGDNVRVIVPHFPPSLLPEFEEDTYRALVDEAFEQFSIRDFILWFFTPLPVRVAKHGRPRLIVYDCMDELAAFKDADPALQSREQELLASAGIVFTGGPSLYDAKRKLHANVRLFPSSVDSSHFRDAPTLPEPAEMRAIARPRIGYCGVIDERIDVHLLSQLAALRPAWQFVLLGPVVKIDPATLPQAPNLHYLGYRTYHELPAHLASWDVAMMPFADNAATRYISPTKTLEYVAAAKPIVSTPIRDVVGLFGDSGCVRIAASIPDFINAIEESLSSSSDRLACRAAALLQDTSWDRTADEMSRCIADASQRLARPMSVLA